MIDPLNGSENKCFGCFCPTRGQLRESGVCEDCWDMRAAAEAAKHAGPS